METEGDESIETQTLAGRRDREGHPKREERATEEAAKTRLREGKTFAQSCTVWT